jgi:amidase
MLSYAATTMDEITSLSASRLAELIRLHELSPVAIVHAYLHRIEEVNPSLNAIVTLAPHLLEQAQAAEDRLTRGESLGPLHGVPLTIKDTIETAALRSTSGSALRAAYVPERDAPAVSRLKNAGAIILGKTNTAEMAMDYTADNPVFGRTNNPHDRSRTPGGSSGGEAVAIAARISPAGIGSDLAGSIRIPAHFCGVAGLKPGTGLIPGGGQLPESIGPYALGSAIGPLARRVEDLSLLFNVLAGAETTRPLPSLSEPRERLRGWHVGWYADDGVVPVTNETRRAVVAAVNVLSAAGMVTEECHPPGIERGHELWLQLFSRASVVALREMYSGREAEAGAFVSWRLATADDGLPCTLDEYLRGWRERDRLRATLTGWMENTPLIVCPVGATPAFEHGAHKVTIAGQKLSIFRAFSYAQTFNLFDLPAVSIPARRSAEGLPIGVQIVGRPGGEADVLAAAAVVEESLGIWPPVSDNVLAP